MTSSQAGIFESTVKKIENFYKQVVMPELLGKQYTNITIIPPPIDTTTTSTTQDIGSTTSKALWCYCKKSETIGQ